LEPAGDVSCQAESKYEEETELQNQKENLP